MSFSQEFFSQDDLGLISDDMYGQTDYEQTTLDLTDEKEVLPQKRLI